MTQQEEFDRMYITSGEICDTLQVNRSSLLNAKNRGLLPTPIFVNGTQLQIWKRAEIEGALNKWRRALNIRRGEIAA